MPPRIMIVSDWRFQHSPMFGQDALSQTVCRPSSATRFLRSKKTSPAGIFIRIQGGFGWNCGRASAASPRFGLEDAQAARAGFDDAGRHFGWWNLPPGSMLRWAGSCGGGQAGWGGRHRRDTVRPRAARPRRSGPRQARTRGASPGRPRRRFGLGRYGEAAAKYEAAFALRPDPALLYNAAQSHRLAGNKPRALELYRNYVRLYPDGASAEDARGHVSALKKVVEDQPRPQPASPTPPPARRRPRRLTTETLPPSFETPAPAAPLPAAATPPSPRTNASVPLLSRPAPAPAEAKRRSPRRRGSGSRVGAAVAVVGTTVILLASRGETFPEPTFGTARGN